MKKHLLIALTLALLGSSTDGYAQSPCCLFSFEHLRSLQEHVFGGLPDQTSLLVRQGYVASYDSARRVPRWVAYHVTPAYLDTPPRQGRFKRFRNDPDLSHPVSDSEYNGLMHARGYARGHLAPYAVMGGDRDGDGLLAEDDPDDAATVFQANYMSNVAPQHHNAFNGAGGIWFKLERWIQDTLVRDGGRDAWIFAGSIFGAGAPEQVGPDRDIAVPPLFYKMVITTDSTGVPRVLAFLLPHHRARHGEIEDYLVSVDILEALTGLDFFSVLDDDVERPLEDADTWDTWMSHFAPQPLSTAASDL